MNITQHTNSETEFYRLRLSRSKLKAVSRTSALFSGFAMVAMVELDLAYHESENSMNTDQIYSNILPVLVNGSSSNATRLMVRKIAEQQIEKYENQVPQWVLILYAVITTLLIACNMMALMISTCILPQIEALSLEKKELKNLVNRELSNRASALFLNAPETQQNLNGDETELDSRFLSLNRRIIDNNRRSLPASQPLFGHGEPAIMFPYQQYHRYIELSWISSTVVGIFLFLVEVGLICFIKFYPINHQAALIGALVMTPILIIFVIFTYNFYKGLAGFKMDLTRKVLGQIDHNIEPAVNVV